MIRLILIAIPVSLFFILSILTLPLTWIIGLFSRQAKDKISYFLVTKTFFLVRLASGVKLEIRGRENIPKNQAVLYVANHRSYFDIILNYSILPPLMGFVSKIEIKKVPILAQWMENMHCLFLDRSTPKEGLKMIHEGVDKLKSGISIFIFPEGTRAKSDDSIAEFKGGSLKMAEKANIPIVPVAINNTSAIFEDQFPFIKKAHVIIEYCQPIILSELGKEEKKFLARDVHNVIESKVLEHIKEI
ncbi:MAG: 1-acyl-sn-glycerol-3-phosphate acyltransferase [Lachnospiraceae bacterium]|nr:1-acyl-sn-glycerol-3-phosphate acyltransferase [Lachnospiraceae bacterium]MCI8825918.1 1-acyl-sn-glycerol-3-phosphate acyltransferase [Lachnospiraceae bacterium]